MLPSEANGLKWAGLVAYFSSRQFPCPFFKNSFLEARAICLQRTTRRRLGLVLPSAEGEERFAAGANLFWFDEGI